MEIHSRLAPFRLTILALTALALLTLSGALPAFSQQGSGPSSTQQQSWWSSQFAYRQSVTITNPTASALSNYPVFLLVKFPFSHVSDATAELRLIDQAGAEVPSYVLGEMSSSGFVTSAWVLTFASLNKSASETLELYYGSATATTPNYRVDNATAKAHAGALSVDVSGTQPASSSVQVTFGGTYSQQILSKVSYGAGTLQAYGASEISQAPAAVVSPLNVVANVSSSEVALSSVFSAGAVRYTQAFLLYNDTLVTARLLTNTGLAAVSDVTLTDLVDSSSLAALGPLSTSYSPTSGLLSTEVSQAYFGYSSNSTASSYEVGSNAHVVSDATSGELSNSTSGAGTAAALSWRLGALAAGGSTQVVSAWGVGRNYSDLAGSVGRYTRQPETSIGPEDTFNGTLSQVTSSWNVNVPITNGSVSSGGLTLPVSLQGASPIASRISLSGTVSYVLPTGYAIPGSQTGWVPQTGTTGNVSAYSTTGFYSIQQQSYTDSVRVTSGSGGGSGAAQLVSPVLSFPAGVSKSLTLRYNALFSGSGDLANQWLYVAVDASQTAAGPFTQTLVVPTSGSSASVGGSGCESLPLKGIPVSTGTAKETTSGALVADGSWRNLNVSLDGAFGTGSLFARIRFCAATAPGYSGQVGLDVASAGIEARGDAPSFLGASVSAGGSALKISFIPGATFEPSSLTLNGMVSFPALGTTPLTWDGSTAYNGTIQGLLQAAPKGQNQTSKASTVAAATTTANATFVGATISPPPYGLVPDILVNGSAVKGETVGNVIFLNSANIIGGGFSTFHSVDLALIFAGHQLGITVKDAAGNPLSGAAVSIQTGDSSPMNEPATSTGSLSLELLPSTYAIAVDFQGVSVGTANVNLTSDQIIVVPTSVYSIPLQVKNAVGGPVEGANITVSTGSSTFALTSDHDGMASFLGVPNKEYNVTVAVAGSTYYAGTILGSSSAATFDLGTSYLPASIQTAIVGAVVASMIVASLVVFLARRRPKTY